MRLALQNVYVPWVPPTARQPGRHRQRSREPHGSRLLRRRALGDRLLPHRPALPPQDGPGRLQGSGGGERWCSTPTFSRETRDGNKNTTFYGGPDYEVATPIDYRTDNFRLSGDYAKGRFFFSASADFSSFRNEVPFVEIDNPERLELQNPANGATCINDVALLPPLDAPRQRGLPGRPHGRHHAAQAAQAHGLAVHRQHEMDMALLPISTNPNLQTSATDPNPAFTVVPPYGEHRGASTTPSWAS